MRFLKVPWALIKEGAWSWYLRGVLLSWGFWRVCWSKLKKVLGENLEKSDNKRLGESVSLILSRKCYSDLLKIRMWLAKKSWWEWRHIKKPPRTSNRDQKIYLDQKVSQLLKRASDLWKIAPRSKKHTRYSKNSFVSKWSIWVSKSMIKKTHHLDL